MARTKNGVCAVCRVSGVGPEHWRTDSHLTKAAAWDRRHAAEQLERQRANAGVSPDGA